MVQQVQLSMRLFASLHSESCPAELQLKSPHQFQFACAPINMANTILLYMNGPPFQEPKAFIFNVYAVVSCCIMLYLSHSKKAAVEEFRKDVFGLAGFFVYKEAKKLINSNRSSQDSQSPQSALQS